ncbi:MAG: SDR family oxidoreductase [Henriciella sp.]
MASPKAEGAVFDLSGRTALITGSTRGIGLTLAKGLRAAGARIILNGRNSERVQTVVDYLSDLPGSDVLASSFDVTHEEDIQASISELACDGATPDILINNAGIQYRKPLVDLELENWQAVIGTNLTSAFLVGRTCARFMLQKGHGKIINIGSVQTALGRPTIAAYAASKGGLKMLTQSMCCEWASKGLQINSIAPGYFHTELTQTLVDDPSFSSWVAARTPAGRWGNVEELVGAAVFLAAPASNFVNGQTLFVDGGMTAVV